MQNNTYNVFADNVHSGKFQSEQSAFKFADCFSKFHGVKRVSVKLGRETNVEDDVESMNMLLSIVEEKRVS